MAGLRNWSFLCFRLFCTQSKTGSRDKWLYSDEDIVDIVQHTQTLALLRPSDHKLNTDDYKQVEYLKSKMRIAQILSQVDTEGVEPLHNITEEISSITTLRHDTLPPNEQTKAIVQSKLVRDNFVVLPSIPASKSSR